MEIIEEKTYVLFNRTISGIIDEIVAPVLQSDVENSKNTMFDEVELVEVMEEDSFRLIHAEEYYNDFYNNWTDYIVILLEKFGYSTDVHNPNVPDDDYTQDIEYDINKDVIDVYGLCIVTKDKDDILIRFDIEASSIDVAFVTQQLIKYTENVFDIVIDDYIHIQLEEDNKVVIYYGEEAVEKYYNDKLYQWDLN